MLLPRPTTFGTLKLYHVDDENTRKKFLCAIERQEFQLVQYSVFLEADRRGGSRCLRKSERSRGSASTGGRRNASVRPRNISRNSE